MATKPSWLTTNPASGGSGNGAIQNSASEHTGRVARTGTVTVTATALETPKTYKVTQSPKAEFVSFNDGAEMAAGKAGGALTIQGKSNSAKLAFSWVGSVEDVEIPESYQANGSSANNGEAISGDPGAQNEYDFSIQLTLPENDTVDEVVRTLLVTADGGQNAQISIKQAAGDPTLEIDPTEITIPQAGTPAVSVQVTSNTTWTIS